MTRKPSPRTGKRRSVASASAAEVPAQAGDISHVTGDVNIAAKLVQQIETFKPRDLTYGETVEKELEIEVRALARGVDDYLARLQEQASAAPASVPYKELEAYTLSESSIFFGRDRAIRSLSRALKRSRLTVFQAESGAGKTSLLQAGIMPHVIEEGQPAVLIRPQFENPSRAIKETFLGNLELTPRLAQAPLVDFLRKVKGLMRPHTTLYLLLDQFEEFFSKKTLEADRQEFIRDLAACLKDTTLNVRWVISITTDAFGQLGKFEPFIQDPFSNVESLYLFTRQEACEVIERSARHYGLSFEADLLDCILNDLGNQQEHPIAPTQIQLVCTALYNDLRDQGTLFTCEQYMQRGGAQGILHDYLGNMLHRKLPPEERSVAYKVLEALVTSEKRRLIRTKSELELDLRNKGIPAETIEATLDHLVAGRLLRRYGEDPHRIQYEIVHDYLLKEIEIDDEARRLKEAEELLEQGCRNWEKQKLLLAPDALKILEAAADLPTSAAAAKLLFLSALEYGRPARRWMESIPPEEQKSLAASLFVQKRDRKNREALWLLRPHLTGAQKAKVGAARSGLRFWGSIRKGSNAFLVALAIFVTAIFAIDLTAAVIQWTEVKSFASQCLGGGHSSGPLVAIDAMDPSHVVGYDPQSRTLCETRNTGAKWILVDPALPADLAMNAMAVHANIYLATSRGVYYQSDDAVWQSLGPYPEQDFDAMRITIASDQESIYVSTRQDVLYRYDSAAGNWQQVPREGITGKITDITVNYMYLAVSTTDGIWYRKLGADETWVEYDMRLPENPGITSIEMVYHVSPWGPLVGLRDNDWFLATSSAGVIYSGYLVDSRGLNALEDRLPAGPLTSLAVNEASRFIIKQDVIYCRQTWTILDKEWWLRSRFSTQQPCS